MGQRMNYIAELNAFHDYLLLNQLSTSEIALWHALVHINNKTMWKTEFAASNLMLQQLTGLSISGIASARNKLKQRGVLEYIPGKARQAGKYHLFYFSKTEYEQAWAQNECRNERGIRAGVDSTLIYINENRNKKEKIQKKKSFIPPTPEQVEAYCLERKNKVDAQRFVDYYTANGWQVGKNKMKDWKAAVRTWERNAYDSSQNGQRWEKGNGKRSSAIDERDYAPGELEAKIHDPIEEILRKQEAEKEMTGHGTH